MHPHSPHKHAYYALYRHKGTDVIYFKILMKMVKKLQNLAVHILLTLIVIVMYYAYQSKGILYEVIVVSCSFRLQNYKNSESPFKV